MTTKTYFLRKNVYICFAGRSCVILDLRHDRYLSVDRRKFALIGPSLSGWQKEPNSNPGEQIAPSPDTQFARELLQAGLLTQSSDDSQLARPPTVPTPTHS